MNIADFTKEAYAKEIKRQNLDLSVLTGKITEWTEVNKILRECTEREIRMPEAKVDKLTEIKHMSMDAQEAIQDADTELDYF